MCVLCAVGLGVILMFVVLLTVVAAVVVLGALFVVVGSILRCTMSRRLIVSMGKQNVPTTVVTAWGVLRLKQRMRYCRSEGEQAV